MRYYDMDEYWEDSDNQDEEYKKPYKEEYTFGSDRDQTHEERKRKAALYIRAHFKVLMKDEAYKEAYYKLVDEFAREFSYMAYHKSISVVSDEQREFEGAMLDFQISVKGRKEIEKYKDDAIYIVDWVKSGKNLIVYI